MIKCLQFLSLIILLAPSALWSTCTGSSPTWSSSADSTSVQSCINSASAGDTINIATGTATWGANAVVISANKPIKLIGPGAANLTVTLSGNNAVVVGSYTGSLSTQTATRISGVKFVSPLDAKYTAIVISGQGWRVDHCEYQGILTDTEETTGFFVTVTGINTTVQPFGLIDNNTLINGKIDIAFNGTSNSQSTAWSDDLDLGGSTAIYIEDNVFSSTVNGKVLVMDDGYGSKKVVRYNNFTNVDTGGHSLQSAGDRGPRKTEFYGNKYVVDHDSVFAWIEIQSGTGVVFSNTFTGWNGDWSGHYYLAFDNKRGESSVGCLGTCDGSYAWDGNESGQSGWLCRDQVGTGGDTGWSGYDGNCGGTPTAQTKMPLYTWNSIGTTRGIYNYDSTHIQSNRDYYLDEGNCAAGSTCTTGTGCGSALPTSCATGTGFWVTTQNNCTVLTGYVGDSAQRTDGINTKIEGTFYKCTATNTWTEYYTPYTYPHPLRGEVVAETAGSGVIFSGVSGTGCQ
jgi:hypothetical protein